MIWMLLAHKTLDYLKSVHPVGADADGQHCKRHPGLFDTRVVITWTLGYDPIGYDLSLSVN